MAHPTTAGSHASQVMTDHEEIKQWAETRGARPARVKDPSGEDDVGLLRLDFSDDSDAQSLEPISWEEWFEKFDERALALIVEHQPLEGDTSSLQ